MQPNPVLIPRVGDSEERVAEKHKKYLIHEQCSIRDAFKQMDTNQGKFVLVSDDRDVIIGIVTDGDFRRAIFNGVSFKERVSTITNRDFIHFNHTTKVNEIKQVFLKNKNIQQIPILKNGFLHKIVFQSHFNKIDLESPVRSLSAPVVIMAGGKGTRLDPFTRILPKPLIPIHDLPVTEVIMDRFAKHGMQDFHISIFDKGKMVKAYFDDFEKPYKINFIEEKEPRGTFGALSMLKGQLDQPFFVTNCDIIIDTDYSKFYDFHVNGGFAISIIGSIRHFSIPYGVCKIDSEGALVEMTEKPQYDFLVNTGFYIISPQYLDLIPDEERYDFTHFIEDIRTKGRKIGVYPVSEKSWLDVGQWGEYNKTVEVLAA